MMPRDAGLHADAGPRSHDAGPHALDHDLDDLALMMRLGRCAECARLKPGRAHDAGSCAHYDVESAL